jgi:hypothetical protein
MKKISITLCFAVVAALFAVRPDAANALPEFKKEFDKKYAEGPTPEKQSLAEAIKGAKCDVCHDPTKGPDGLASKKNHNPYGKALQKYIKKADKKDIAKILKALEAAEAEKGPDGNPYGERIKAGKLPVEATVPVGK